MIQENISKGKKMFAHYDHMVTLEVLRRMAILGQLAFGIGCEIILLALGCHVTNMDCPAVYHWMPFTSTVLLLGGGLGLCFYRTYRQVRHDMRHDMVLKHLAMTKTE